MTPKVFSPARYTETAWCIIDKSTGEILATETVWTDEDAERYEQGPSSTLLSEFAEYPDGRHRDIEAIPVDRPSSQAAERVDLAERAPVTSLESSSAGSLRPLRIERP